MTRTRWRKTLFGIAKLGISLALLAYVVGQAIQNSSFSQFRDQPKHWGLLAAALLCCLGSVALTFVRWWMLVVALGLPFSLRDAFRLGFLGYLLNFVALGSVGGDLFKAIFIAREHRDKKIEAIATVIADRAAGLYALLMVASGAFLFGNLPALEESPQLLKVRTLTYALTIVGAVLIAILLGPDLSNGRFLAFLSRTPGVGRPLVRMIEAIRLYRHKLGVLAVTLVMSLGVHILLAITLWLTARGLPGGAPSLADHLVILPVASLVSAIPIFPAGLGAMEATVDLLYRQFGRGTDLEPGKGLLVALGYRVLTVIIAMIGVGYYLSARREVAAVMHEAEAEPEDSA